MVSAYSTTRPSTLRAARPMVWMSEEAERRKPSLSASRMATSATSGRSRPSRSRLMPTRTSNSPEPQLAQDLDAGDGVDVGVQVLDPHARLGQVVGQVLGHLLGQGGDQHPVAAGHGRGRSARGGRRSGPWSGMIVDLGVDQAGGPDDLLDHLARVLELERARAWPTRRRTWPHPLDELLEAQRPVVHGRGQAEAVLDQRLLAGAVPGVLAVQLGHGHVALVDDAAGSPWGRSRAGCRAPRPGARPSRWRL